MLLGRHSRSFDRQTVGVVRLVIVMVDCKVEISLESASNIIRYFRNPKVSDLEKLEKTSNILNNINKDNLLSRTAPIIFEWLVNAILRHSNEILLEKNNESVFVYNINVWIFLTTLVKSFLSNQDEKTSDFHPGIRNSLNNIKIPPIYSIFHTLFINMDKVISSSDGNNLFHAIITSYFLIDNELEFLLKPKTELLIESITKMCELEITFNIYVVFLQFVNTSINRLDKSLKLITNDKKQYILFVGKCMVPLLKLNIKLDTFNDHCENFVQEIKSKIINMINKYTFNNKVWLDFQQINHRIEQSYMEEKYNEINWKKENYTKVFFDVIEEEIKNDNNFSNIWIPFIVELYLKHACIKYEENRELRKNTAVFDFGFIAYFIYKIEGKPDIVNSKEWNLCLSTIYSLARTYNVYLQTNDAFSQLEYTYFSKKVEKYVDEVLKNPSECYLKILSELLKYDHKFVEKFFINVCEISFIGNGDINLRKKLVEHLVHIYIKTKRFPKFIDGIFDLFKKNDILFDHSKKYFINEDKFFSYILNNTKGILPSQSIMILTESSNSLKEVGKDIDYLHYESVKARINILNAVVSNMNVTYGMDKQLEDIIDDLINNFICPTIENAIINLKTDKHKKSSNKNTKKRDRDGLNNSDIFIDVLDELLLPILQFSFLLFTKSNKSYINSKENGSLQKLFDGITEILKYINKEKTNDFDLLKLRLSVLYLSISNFNPHNEFSISAKDNIEFIINNCIGLKDKCMNEPNIDFEDIEKLEFLYHTICSNSEIFITIISKDKELSTKFLKLLYYILHINGKPDHHLVNILNSSCFKESIYTVWKEFMVEIISSETKKKSNNICKVMKNALESDDNIKEIEKLVKSLSTCDKTVDSKTVISIYSGCTVLSYLPLYAANSKESLNIFLILGIIGHCDSEKLKVSLLPLLNVLLGKIEKFISIFTLDIIKPFLEMKITNQEQENFLTLYFSTIFKRLLETNSSSFVNSELKKILKYDTTEYFFSIFKYLSTCIEDNKIGLHSIVIEVLANHFQNDINELSKNVDNDISLLIKNYLNCIEVFILEELQYLDEKVDIDINFLSLFISYSNLFKESFKPVTEEQYFDILSHIDDSNAGLHLFKSSIYLSVLPSYHNKDTMYNIILKRLESDFDVLSKDTVYVKTTSNIKLYTKYLCNTLDIIYSFLDSETYISVILATIGKVEQILHRASLYVLDHMVSSILNSVKESKDISKIFSFAISLLPKLISTQYVEINDIFLTVKICTNITNSKVKLNLIDIQHIIEIVDKIIYDKNLSLELNSKMMFSRSNNKTSTLRNNFSLCKAKREQLYIAICNLLHNIANSYRSNILRIGAGFINCLEGLLFGFTSAEFTVLNPLLTSNNEFVNITVNDIDKDLSDNIFRFVAPLSEECAVIYVRLASSLNQVPSGMTNVKNAKRNSNAAVSKETLSHLTTFKTKLVSPFSMHAPFMLSRLTILLPTLSRNRVEQLKPAIFSFLELAGDRRRNFVLSAFAEDDGRVAILRSWYSEWETSWRFKGEN